MKLRSLTAQTLLFEKMRINMCLCKRNKNFLSNMRIKLRRLFLLNFNGRRWISFAHLLPHYILPNLFISLCWIVRILMHYDKSYATPMRKKQLATKFFSCKNYSIFVWRSQLVLPAISTTLIRSRSVYSYPAIDENLL